MEGRTIVRPDHILRDRHIRPSAPSMEGRTIVRPDGQSRVRGCERHSSFNGGPDNRPARHPPQRPFAPRVTEPPSMEGRTIVRPDQTCLADDLPPTATFNGGPDNRPARRDSSATLVGVSGSLQWRAGQSSGQTGRVHDRAPRPRRPFNGGPDNRPARQGRTRAYQRL